MQFLVEVQAVSEDAPKYGVTIEAVVQDEPYRTVHSAYDDDQLRDLVGRRVADEIVKRLKEGGVV